MAPSISRRLPGSPEPAVRPSVSLEHHGISDMSLASVWTDEDEQELVDIKAKLHRAHKKWSAEQELWLDRVSSAPPPPLPYFPDSLMSHNQLIAFRFDDSTVTA